MKGLALWLLLGTQLKAAPVPTPLSPTRSQVVTDALGCRPDEYWTDGRCCRTCPPGHHVSEPCRSPHTQGTCKACTPTSYTGHPNGLDACLPCSTCRRDQEAVKECSQTSDRLCQCLEGSYQAVESEDICKHCSMCPVGRAILRKCNATTDTVCGNAGPGSRHHLCVIGSFLIFLAIAASMSIFCVKETLGEPFRVGRRPPSMETLTSMNIKESVLSSGQLIKPPLHPLFIYKLGSRKK